MSWECIGISWLKSFQITWINRRRNKAKKEHNDTEKEDWSIGSYSEKGKKEENERARESERKEKGN